MKVKELNFDDDAKKKMQSGIKKLAKAVKITLGPSGRFVGLDSDAHTGGITMTKDGVTVANTINLEDAVENFAVRNVRDAARRTATAAGDGTTTSIVLMEALLDGVDEHVTSDNNLTEVSRYMKSIAASIIKNLDKRAKKLTGRRLYHVATVSANNDKKLGKLIGDAYKYVGREGIVTVANSKTPDVYLEKVDGMVIDRGFRYRNYVTDERRDECVLENPLILAFDQKLQDLRQIAHLIEYAIKVGRPILIIGEMELDASQTFAYNISAKKAFKGCNILPPDFGSRREQMLKDLCTATGATYISENLGNDWANIVPADLGEVDKVVVSESRTVMYNNSDNEELASLIDDLKEKLKEESDDDKKDALRTRISALSGKAVVINVGGNSDIEQKEVKDRVDDSVLATRAALEEGILPGGGVGLLYEAYSNMPVDGDRDEITAMAIMESALQAPFKQILMNAGKDVDGILSKILDADEYGYGYDVLREEFGNTFKMGIIDPAKVTKSALENSVSVATTFMLCGATVTNKMKA